VRPRRRSIHASDGPLVKSIPLAPKRVGVCVRKVIQVHYVVDDGREDEATDAN
jgi:hypothetical protein